MADPYLIDGHKMHYHPDRVHLWKEGDKSQVFPIYVEISPVGHCNHRCTFCAVDYIGYKVRKIETERFKIIISDMAKHGVKSVMFAGEGEPLLHPDLPEIIKHTKECGIDVAITTNGVALTGKFIEGCLDYITWVKVSCNAGNKEDYARVHQTKEGDWYKVWDNLQRAVKKGSGCTIGVQALLLPDNAGGIEGLVQKAKEVGLAYTVIKPYSQHKKSITRTYEEVTYDQYVDTLVELEKYSSPGYQVVARRQSMESWDSKERRYQKCYSTPYMWAYIMATGDVYGCSAYLLDERFKYGNINEATFSEVWLGEKRRKSMEYVENELCIEECRVNCRMNKVNQYLWDLKHKTDHVNFI